jgi:gas vesicle protein
VPVSAMLIFAVDTHAAATSRVLDTLVGAAAGLAAGLLYAPLRVQPARDAVGDLTRQMSELLGRMAAGLKEAPDPRRAAEWLEQTRALRGEIERVDDALSSAEDSVRLNPRMLGSDPAAGLRESVDTLERAATDMRVLARSVADSARIDSERSPVKEAETRAQLASMLGDLSAAVSVYGELIQAGTPPVGQPPRAAVSERPRVAVGVPLRAAVGVPLRAAVGERPRTVAAPAASTARLEEHLRSAAEHRDRLAGLLRADPSQHPDDWPLRGEILAHVDRLRAELEPRRPPGRTDSTGPTRILGDRRRRRRAKRRATRQM